MSDATVDFRPDAPGKDGHRAFFVLWTGQALSLVGSQAVQFALIWWLTVKTGSPAILATATLVGLLPQIVLGPVIGPLIDRWDRKRAMLAADAGVALASLALAGLFAAGAASVGPVLLALFARALGGAFHAPAMLASTSLMVKDSHLTRVQGLNQGLEGLLNIVAAPLGALLLSVLSMSRIMLIDVGTAALAIAPLCLIRIPRPRQGGCSDERRPFLRELGAGFRYLAERRGHLTLVGMSAAINMCLVPAFSLLPLIVLQRLGGDAGDLGGISAAFGVGVLAGGIGLGVWGGFKRRIDTTLVGMIALGLAVAAVGLAPEGSFAFVLVAMLSVGLVVPFVNGPVHAVLQATIEPHYQGRVFTLVSSLAGATAPIGLLAAAPVAEAVGVRVWYLCGGALSVAMGIAGFFSSALTRIEERSPHGVSGSGAGPLADSANCPPEGSTAYVQRESDGAPTTSPGTKPSSDSVPSASG